MYIAVMNLVYVSRDEVPAEVVENERRIAEATAREESKPESAIPRIIERHAIVQPFISQYFESAFACVNLSRLWRQPAGLQLQAHGFQCRAEPAGVLGTRPQGHSRSLTVRRMQAIFANASAEATLTPGSTFR